MNKIFFYYQLICVALLPIIMQGAESHKFSNVITCAIKGISNKQSEPQTDYTSGITRALGHIRTQGQPQQPYASTIAQPLFNDTVIINYKSLEEIPSDTLRLNLEDTEGGNNILWDCSSLHPSITKDMIDKAFSYAEKIRQGIAVDIAHKDIIPCYLIAQYLLFEQTITSYFAVTFLNHSASLDLTTYFNKATLGIDDTKLITQYHNQFIERAKQDAPSLDNIPDMASVFEKNLEEIVVDENATTYMLDFSCKALQYVLYRSGNLQKAFKDIPHDIKKSIATVNLSGHKLTSIDLGLFKSVFPNLVAIDLTNNSICTLDDQFFKQLPHNVEVILTSNPIATCTNTSYPRSGCVFILDTQVYTRLGRKIEKLLQPSSGRKTAADTIEHSINTYGDAIRILCFSLPVKIISLLPVLTAHTVATVSGVGVPSFLVGRTIINLIGRNIKLNVSIDAQETLKIATYAVSMIGCYMAHLRIDLFTGGTISNKIDRIMTQVNNKIGLWEDFIERQRVKVQNRFLEAARWKNSIVVRAESN